MFYLFINLIPDPSEDGFVEEGGVEPAVLPLGLVLHHVVEQLRGKPPALAYGFVDGLEDALEDEGDGAHEGRLQRRRVTVATSAHLGADFKNNQSTKQLNNFIWTNMKQVKFCFYLLIGPNKIVQLFNCLVV